MTVELGGASGSAVDAPLGYSCGTGGIGNQKYALLGLFLRASQGREAGRNKIVLPALGIFDQAVNFGPGAPRPETIPLADVYWPDMLADFAVRRGVEIVPGPARPGEDSWDYFTTGGHLPEGAFLAGRQSPADFASDFFRSLIPKIRNSELFTDLHVAAFVERRIRAVVQMRIEADWRAFGDAHLHAAVGQREDHSPSAHAIMAKTAYSLPEVGRTVYVASDEAHLPAAKDEIRAEIRQIVGIELVWKSDLLAPDRLRSMSALDLSLLDFEMAVSAEMFVGNTRSTFSNLAAFERYSRQRAPVTTHYLYNVPERFLRARTDNGACYTAAQASAGAPSLAPAADGAGPRAGLGKRLRRLARRTLRGLR